jgi:hypothetical protein
LRHRSVVHRERVSELFLMDQQLDTQLWRFLEMMHL